MFLFAEADARYPLRIGINVDSKRALSDDEVRFKDALRNNREDVEKVLGSAGGLAYQTYAKTESIRIRQRSQSLYQLKYTHSLQV